MSRTLTSDEQAAEMILPVVNTCFDVDAAEATHQAEQVIIKKYQGKMKDFIEKWGE